MPNESPTLLLDTRDLSNELRLSRRTVQRMLAAGTLPEPVRLPGHRALRWRRADIEAWIAAGCPAGTAVSDA